ncbi:MAG: CorA family divalent cation transporter [Acidimicrobiales bacterium]
MSDAILFDRDDVDHVELADRPPRLGRAQLLWVDVERGSADAREVVEALSLEDATARYLETPQDRPVFSDHGRYLHVTTCAPRDDDAEELQTIECLVGESWVVTVHDQPIPVLDEFAARASGSGDTGMLDGPGFLAALLEWLLGTYTAAFERIEQDLEEFDTHAMRGEAVADDIEVLIAMRRKVGTLRRALAAHRAPLMALTHPELVLLGNDRSSERFERLYDRYEATLQEARDAREAIVGSFDVLIARDGQETNQIMKVLTLASVILLPGALVAGVMGMNFKVGLFEHDYLFWVVLAVIVCVAPLTVAIAKQRRWI